MIVRLDSPFTHSELVGVFRWDSALTQALPIPETEKRGTRMSRRCSARAVPVRFAHSRSSRPNSHNVVSAQDAARGDALYNTRKESGQAWLPRTGVHPLRPLRYSPIVAGLLLALLSAGLEAAEADPPSAREVIDSQIKSALAVLRDAKLTPAQKRQKISQIADQHTDFETLSRLTLGRYWRDLSADQRTAFVDAFKTHLSNTYGNLLNGYGGQDVTVTGDRREPDGDWTVQIGVFDTINGARLELAKVDCRLRRKAEWKVIDVIPEGVSLVALFRAQFQDIMANGGFDRLLRLLRAKVGEQGASGSPADRKDSGS